MPSPYIRADLAPAATVRSILRRRSRSGGTAEHQEGWQADPLGRHEARWMSDGTPTPRVRDGELESWDAPDEEPPPSS